MINFTIGPVASSDVVREIGAEQVPYFRTEEFSKKMKENERLILELSKAPKGSRVVFLTGSGSAAMEAAVINTLSEEDKVLVVNGGSFGGRFVELLSLHKIPFSEIKVPFGEQLTKEMLWDYDDCGYTAFIVNVHETSVGLYYDLDMISEFCKKNGLFLLVDAISSFLADDLDMSTLGVDIMIAGSQKALACPPGISILVLSDNAINRVNQIETKCMYLDLKDALKNGERGQTPFTPAVSILLQINARLNEIVAAGGVQGEVDRTKRLAEYFRKRIKDLPFEIASKRMSNAVTPLKTNSASANDIFITLKDEYEIWVCPNGGELKDTLFRVGHIGALSESDYDQLINALYDMQARGLL